MRLEEEEAIGFSGVASLTRAEVKTGSILGNLTPPGRVKTLALPFPFSFAASLIELIINIKKTTLTTSPIIRNN